jgi:hypothetical protein
MLRKTIASILVLAVTCGGGIRTVRADEQAAVEQAKNAAAAWLKLVDDGKYQQSWDQAAQIFKGHVTADRWEQMVGAVRKPLGAVVSRNFKLAHYSTTLPGAPDGQYVVIQYDTTFANKKAAVETVTPMLDTAGQWRVSGYFIN